jgi:hypothetical protein
MVAPLGESTPDEVQHRRRRAGGARGPGRDVCRGAGFGAGEVQHDADRVGGHRAHASDLQVDAHVGADGRPSTADAETVTGVEDPERVDGHH